MSTTTAPDLLDPKFWADLDGMHAFFTERRAEGPLYRDETNNLWAIVRHAEVLEVERRDEEFTSRPAYRSFGDPSEANMIAKDDPEHIEQRKLVSDRFTPKGVREYVPRLESLITELIDGLVADVARDGSTEVVDGLAAQLPSRLTTDLLGFPEDTWRDVKSWSERLMRIDSVTRDNDAAFGMFNAIQEFAQVLDTTAEERRGCPANDLITTWVQNDFDQMQLIHETGLFISGGAETTRTAISRGIRVLADHPEFWEAAAEDPALVPGMVEEILRWVTPLNNFFRNTARDTEIAGQPIAAGARICFVYPSANRDELVFDDPFTFDIRRSPNRHVAFGYGTHFCLGVNLARTELRLLFGALTQRLTNLRVVTEPDIEDNVFAGAVRSFRIAFDER
jgi:cytochrome P450 family 142 subfamily A polypeptide 1